MKDRSKLVLVVLAIIIAAYAATHVARILELRSHGEYAIWDAMRGGGTDELEMLLELGADPNRIEEGNMILLNEGVKRSVGDSELDKLLLLLEYGANPNLVDFDGMSAYENNLFQIRWKRGSHYESQKEIRIKLNEAFLDAGVKETVFSLVLNEQWDTLREWIRNDPTLVQKKFYMDRTILHLCAANADESFIRFLLQNGADINAVDELAMTPAMTSYILDQSRGELGLDIGLFFYQSGHVPFSQTDNLPLLVDLGADSEHVGYQNVTLLHLASSFAISESTLEALLPLKNIDATLGKEILPIDLALLHQNLIAVRWLMNHGAVIDSKSVSVAVRKSDSELLRLLLEFGANPNEPNERGSTPLVELVKQLKYLSPEQIEINPEIVDPVLESIEILIEAGVDPFDDTLFYNTPWQVASDQECAPCLELFTKYSVKKAAYLATLPH